MYRKLFLLKASRGPGPDKRQRLKMRIVQSFHWTCSQQSHIAIKTDFECGPWSEDLQEWEAGVSRAPIDG